MVPSMLIEEPGCQIRSRLTEELAKVQENVYILYGNNRRKANGYKFKNGMTNVFLREYSEG